MGVDDYGDGNMDEWLERVSLSEVVPNSIYKIDDFLSEDEVATVIRIGEEGMLKENGPEWRRQVIYGPYTLFARSLALLLSISPASKSLTRIYPQYLFTTSIQLICYTQTRAHAYTFSRSPFFVR